MIGGFLPKTYSSSLSLYFPGGSAKPSASSGLSALTGTGGPDPDANTISSMRGSFSSPVVGSGASSATGILQSKTCLLHVVDTLRLDSKWHMSRWKAFSHLQGSVNVHTEKTGFLRVESTVESPQLCKQILDEMFAHLEKESERLTLNVSRRNRKQIEAQYAASKDKVETVRKKLIAALRMQPMSKPDELEKALVATRLKYEESKVAMQAAKRQLAETKSLIVTLLDPNAKFPQNLSALGAQVRNPQEGSSVAKASLGIIAGQIEERRLELEDIGKQFLASSPEYKEALKRVNSAEQLAARIIAKDASNAKRGLRPDLMVAEAQLKALQVTVNVYGDILRQYQDAARQYPEAASKVEGLRAEFGAAISSRTQYEQEVAYAKIAEERDPSRYEVVDPPMEEPDAIAPRKGMLAAVAFLLSLALFALPKILQAGSRETEKSTVED
jgi:hypothetical protein